MAPVAELDDAPAGTAGGQPAWHARSAVDVAAALGSGPAGLSDADARERLARFGPNRIREAPGRSDLAILASQFRGPLTIVLLAAAAVTAVIGEAVDASVIAAVLAVNAVIGFVQERRAERSVRALHALAAPKARVVRDGRQQIVPGEEVVPGDVVVVESGNRIPADTRIAAASGLLVDESMLTGESEPAPKAPDALPEATPVADRAGMLFAGTVAARGRGWGYVVATGDRTELGVIAEEVREESAGDAPLQARLARFARMVGVLAIAAAAAAVLAGVVRGEDAGEMVLFGVALAVSAAPEGLPVAVTIALAAGVRRMARRNAIVRRLPAVETLGSATVIGADKTGTLTQNRMTVQRIWTAGGTILPGTGPAFPAGADPTVAPAPERPLMLTLLAGVLVNAAPGEAASIPGEARPGDPTETALLAAAEQEGILPDEARAAVEPLAVIPFEPDRRFAALVCERAGRRETWVVGAPERVLAMCRDMLGPDGPAPLDGNAIRAAVRDLAADGLRVLAMAGRASGPADPAADPGVEPEGLTFYGLQGMADPPRPGVRESIAACRAAGVRVAMITGDHVETAEAIARGLGIAAPGQPSLTGLQVDALDDAALREAARETAVFARMAPEQKLRVVHAWRASGEIVAVTGDGVNDAPALEAADIGVAMGRGGADVAREAADVVLTDDDFSSIVAAVEEGRITFDNVRRVVFFLVSANAAEVVVMLAALILGWPLPLLAVQVLWLNLVTDALPVAALAFEPGDPGVMRRGPRPVGEGILSRVVWERVALSAVAIAAGTLALFHWEFGASGSLAQARTAALTALVMFQLVQAVNARSSGRALGNPFLLAAMAGSLALHAAAIWLPWTQRLLRVEPLTLEAWLRVALVGAAILVVVQVHARLRRD